MRPSATRLLRPAIWRLATTVALAIGAGAALSACANTDPPPEASGSSIRGADDSGMRPRFTPNWSEPDFGGPPPWAH
jgi:hypothetical protein